MILELDFSKINQETKLFFYIRRFFNSFQDILFVLKWFVHPLFFLLS